MYLIPASVWELKLYFYPSAEGLIKKKRDPRPTAKKKNTHNYKIKRCCVYAYHHERTQVDGGN